MIAVGCALALVLAGCASDEPAAAPMATAPPPAEPTAPPPATEAPAAPIANDNDQPPARLIATTSIWADLTRNVACGGLAEVESVLPPLADPHDFEPSMADRARLDAADLIVANGLGLEVRLVDTLASAEADGTPIFSAGEYMTTLAFDAEMFGGHEDHADHEDHGDHDEDDEHEDDHDEDGEHEHEDDHGDGDHEDHDDDHGDEDDHDEDHDDGDHEDGDDDHGDDHEDHDEHEHEDDHDDHDDHRDDHGDDDHEDHDDDHGDEDDHDDHDHDEDHDDHEDHDEDGDHDEHEDDHDDHGDHGDDDHDEHEHEDHHEHDHGSEDPHVWLDPVRVAQAVESLSVVLVDRLGLDADRVAACSDAYLAELAQLHEDIAETLDAVPPARRKLVTNHDSLGYFADRYGFEVIGTIIPALTTLAEPSPAGLEALAELIQETGVPAIFAEELGHGAGEATALADRLDGVSVASLYTGALGPAGSGAESYLAMMRRNARIIAEALGG